MKFNVLYLFLLAYVSGVIGDDNIPVIINKKNHTDVPAAITLEPNANNTTTVAPTTTTLAPTTTPSTNTTTVPTTTKPTPTPSPNTTTTTAPTTPTTTTTVSPPTTNGTTTTPATISTSTESTTVVPTGAPSHKGRKFDGPSFIGGIILASGLMAICFVSWKFYKARTERNYHTL